MSIRRLVIAEKNSVARSIAAVLGAVQKQSGYLEGNGYLVSWCVGHLVELAQASVYNTQYQKWRREDLPIIPNPWQYVVSEGTKQQFAILSRLMNAPDVESIICATDVMCFLNLFNEFYSRDTSKKVKAVKKACAENGKFMGTYPAYGYCRDPLDKHHLIIDEETAPTVRRMFAMRAAGMGYHAIASALNEEGIVPPGVLYYQRKGVSDPRNVNHKWAGETVKSLIRKEVYIGHMVQGKTGTMSYKSRKLVQKPEDEWIRVENTHEPIISREVWDTCVALDQKKVRKSPTSDGIKSIFTGLVYCADCGFKMRNHIERFTYKDGRPGRYSSFICGNYARSGKNACSIHSIYETALEHLVLADIREKARYASCDRDKLMEQIIRLKAKESHSRLAALEREWKASTLRLTELERLMQSLYEDKCNGTVPQTVFQTLMKKYEAEHAEKAAALPDLESKVKAQRENTQEAGRWSDIISSYPFVTLQAVSSFAPASLSVPFAGQQFCSGQFSF